MYHGIHVVLDPGARWESDNTAGWDRQRRSGANYLFCPNDPTRLFLMLVALSLMQFSTLDI
jgi:hypothetical protein